MLSFAAIGNITNANQVYTIYHAESLVKQNFYQNLSWLNNCFVYQMSLNITHKTCHMIYLLALRNGLNRFLTFARQNIAILPFLSHKTKKKLTKKKKKKVLQKTFARIERNLLSCRNKLSQYVLTKIRENAKVFSK